MQTEPVSLFVEAWRQMTGRLPSPLFVDKDGVASCFSDVPNLFFNLWVQSRPATLEEEFRGLLATAAQRAATSTYATGGIIRDDWSPLGWEDIAKEVGLAPMVPMISMETDGLLEPRRRAADLDIRRVIDDSGARDLAMLNARAYGMPLELWECVSGMHFWPSDCCAFVGYVGEVPVSCAAALPINGTVYIAVVATAPDQQGKGYAETVMRRAVAEGQRTMGITRTTLHASMMGHPLYRAMGYLPGPRLVLVGPQP
jgi:GNAT superfamily N-acetyltransferase